MINIFRKVFRKLSIIVVALLLPCIVLGVLSLPVRAYTIYSALNKYSGTNYDVYMGSTVVKIEKYHPLQELLRRAHEQDVFRFHLASYGGSVQAGIQLIHAIENSKAKVIMIAEAPNYSMGALLMCVGNKQIFRPYSSLMYHSASTSGRGKISEQMKYMQNIRLVLKKLMIDKCVNKGILTKKEVMLIDSGIDIYKLPGDIR